MRDDAISEVMAHRSGAPLVRPSGLVGLVGLAGRASLVILGATLSVAACSKPAEEVGAVKVVAGEDGFKPSSVSFKKGQAGTLVFTRTTDETCATEVVFPELDIKKELPKGKPVTITVPTDKERTLTFQCGMGMYKSSVVVSN